MQHAGVGVSSGPFITDMVFVFCKRIGGAFEIVFDGVVLLACASRKYTLLNRLLAPSDMAQLSYR